MARLGANRWGKSEVRLSKIHRGDGVDEFSDIVARVLLEGTVEDSYTNGDNSGVVPTDTMRNTIYGLAQDHLTTDLEAFARVLTSHFGEWDRVETVRVDLAARRWDRASPTGFTGGNSEQRTTSVLAGPGGDETRSGIEGLVVLKTTGSAFEGFPRDRFTILPDAADRLLATSITASWLYGSLPEDTTTAWGRAREAIVGHFFSDWSASVQHQGWLMASAVLDAVAEIEEISFNLPNQHHLPFHLEQFDMEDRGTVFHPVSEPYGDIGFTVHR